MDFSNTSKMFMQRKKRQGPSNLPKEHLHEISQLVQEIIAFLYFELNLFGYQKNLKRKKCMKKDLKKIKRQETSN